MKTVQRHRFIAVEGPIGVGKTSLAEKLAKTFNSELIKENILENPFLEHFYQHNKQSALPVQLHFLTERAKQWDTLGQGNPSSNGIVSDFLLEKDPIFAGLTLTAEEYKLYQQMYNSLSIQAIQPDLVIYLQAPVDTLLSRIRHRGVRYEKNISDEYLQKLSDAYTQFFHGYDRSPLLVVNAADINPLDNEADYQQLLQYIKSSRTGRHFVNPLANT